MKFAHRGWFPLSAVIASCLTTPAVAADKWSGLSISIGIGIVDLHQDIAHAWSFADGLESNVFVTGAGYQDTRQGYITSNPTLLGGAQIGFDIAPTPGIVLGVFADIDLTNDKDAFAIGPQLAGSVSRKVSYAVGGRVGVLLNDDLYPFISVAWR